MSRTTRNYPDWWREETDVRTYREDHQWSTPDPIRFCERAEDRAARRAVKVALLDWEAEYWESVAERTIVFEPAQKWCDDYYCDECEDIHEPYLHDEDINLED